MLVLSTATKYTYNVAYLFFAYEFNTGWKLSENFKTDRLSVMSIFLHFMYTHHKISSTLCQLLDWK